MNAIQIKTKEVKYILYPIYTFQKNSEHRCTLNNNRKQEQKIYDRKKTENEHWYEALHLLAHTSWILASQWRALKHMEYPASDMKHGLTLWIVAFSVSGVSDFSKVYIFLLAPIRIRDHRCRSMQCGAVVRDMFSCRVIVYGTTTRNLSAVSKLASCIGKRQVIGEESGSWPQCNCNGPNFMVDCSAVLYEKLVSRADINNAFIYLHHDRSLFATASAFHDYISEAFVFCFLFLLCALAYIYIYVNSISFPFPDTFRTLAVSYPWMMGCRLECQNFWQLHNSCMFQKIAFLAWRHAWEVNILLWFRLVLLVAFFPLRRNLSRYFCLSYTLFSS